MRKKKYLGQHFLNNKKILEMMCEAAEISKSDTVLEVGSGFGSLTEILAERAKKVITVEKDRDLVPILRAKFASKKNVEIIEGDILAVSPPLGGSAAKSYKIVANIPYYITSHFLRLFLSETKFRPKLMVLMIQKEVAERIVARDGRESLLSLSVKAYGKPEIIRIVPRGAFSPPPKVDSAIIKIVITPTSPRATRPLLRKEREDVYSPPSPLRRGKGLGARGFDIEKILALAKIAFQKKRKMLRQSIGKKVNLPEKYQTARPEELSLDDWCLISKN